ncbi:MAG: M56 family metallopeptidase [bacterium]
MFSPCQLNAWGELWGAYMVRSTVDSALAFGLVGLVWLAVRKRFSVQTGYVLFLLVFVKLFFPGFISLPGLIHSWFSVPLDAFHFTGGGWIERNIGHPVFRENDALSSGIHVTPAASPLPSTAPELSGTFWLMAAWAGTAAVLFMRFMGYQWVIHCRIRQARPVKNKTLRMELKALTERIGLRHPVAWATAGWAGSPVVWGWVHPRIVIPPDLPHELSQEQLHWILLHELAHVRRGDIAVRLIQSLSQIVFFFNPVVRAVNRVVDRLREYACDDTAIVASGASRKVCGEGLLRVAGQTAAWPAFIPFSTGLSNRKSYLKNRIQRILDTRRILERGCTWRSRALLSAFAAVLLPVSGTIAYTSGNQWTRIETPESPVQRQGYAMVYDPERGKAVMFGGFNGNFRYMLNETWEWDGEAWREIPIPRADRPEERFLMSMVYDTARKKIVMYGGGDVIKWRGYDDTWEYDGITWTKRDVKGPGSRSGYALTYDEARGQVVLFGGYDPDLKPTAELWEWDGVQWQHILAGEAPSPRILMSAAYDSRRRKTVIFGGTDGKISFGDTWEWDGVTFLKVAETGPEPRLWGSMTYDTQRGRVILFGGGTDLINMNPARSLGDTWEWDGIRWMELNHTGSVPREMINMTHDARRGKMVWFGGGSRETGDWLRFNDTWELALDDSWH